MRIARLLIELVILSALIVSTRCANYEDVFIGDKIYFTDADCYARMTRVRLCAQHPGLVLRHHNFENFPQGTTPHTTAPLDYAILSLSILLKPFAIDPIDLAGALISPLLALFGGWFLWWWSRGMRFRWVLLILYAISPILVHATELGRPDHQSLVVVLVLIAICAEIDLVRLDGVKPSSLTRWSGVVGAAAWALAIWVSAYEPLLLFICTSAVLVAQDRHLLFAKDRRVGWIVFAAIIALALAIEQRVPSLSILRQTLLQRNWSRTIGEMSPVALTSSIWFRWCGYLILIAPVLVWRAYRRKLQPPLFILALLVIALCLTMWQARWSYIFVSIFAIALPQLLESIKSGAAVYLAFTLSILPILRDWDERLWPNESDLAKRIEARREAVDLRELSLNMMSSDTHAFIAPWWLSPPIAYWSGQPGVAGSSHESLNGIVDSARFFLANDPEGAREILQRRDLDWVVVYDSDRVIANSVALLGTSVPPNPLCRSLERAPSQAARFLKLVLQNGTAKLFQVANKR